MKEKINFNVIEKFKISTEKDIEESIKKIINQLIEKQFVNIQ